MEVIIDSVKYETTQLDNGKWTLPEEIKKCLRSCCGALNIDGNRVEANDKTPFPVGYQSGNFGSKERTADENSTGRYPSQTFITSEIAQVLDMQSGVSKGIRSNRGFATNGNGNNVAFGNFDAVGDNIGGYDDTGGCSKILHKCDYEEGECNLYFYNPKVSKSERNAGCDAFQEVNFAMGGGASGAIKKGLDKYDKSQTIGLQKIHKLRNNHPTLKPIKLNKNILAFFKTPNEQNSISFCWKW